MEWLETLAKRQGAKEEELTTRASMNIPTPPETDVEDDDYQPFSFDTLPTRRTGEVPATTLEDPASWLNSIAGAEGYSETGVRATMPGDEAATPGDDMSLAAIEAAIANGTVTREQMQFFLDQQADQLAADPEAAYDEAEDDGALHPAELPDWLSDLMPEPPAPAETSAPSVSIDALFAAEAAPAMPDWLSPTDTAEVQISDLESIFEPDEEESRPYQPVSLAEEPALDKSDPWVEAFDEEYAQGGATNVASVPEWYEQNVNDPDRIAAVDSAYGLEGQLQEAALPEENSLPAGQPQALPNWVSGVEAEAAPEPAASVFEEMPDWLKEVEASVSPEEVPAWLVETIAQEAEPEAAPEPEPEPEPVRPPPAPVVAAPAPRPVVSAPPPAPKPEPVKPQPARIASGEAVAVLQGARDKEQSGDLEGALADYESVIRSGAALDDVVDDLSLLVKSYKSTPAVYRVLGDGLMRQGKLQAALNTYRQALNQL
jgi:tetratricopeptide (TPR) repeat protein